ncbi:NRDE protein-domain-containing protein [Mucor mucedo]|uniref:NRDE protein-domain-containing protein n=1 Tax=Mucor mucedo TaxID=29922 RepID=UPI002220A24A|nr:NRDE protein-domain-containing protein [Mucor mucedo]KAI7891233.1 NRDE protein-domain-containing protein [Mucor mucedo]
MCILFWTVDNHPKYRFIFAANRDEFLRRPTARAHFWKEPHDNVLAGIDLEAKLLGTWLGITKQGRFAALTNFREPNFRGQVSRGVLVRDFLCGNESVHAAIDNVVNHKIEFGGFNLVYFDLSKSPTDMAYCTNREDQQVRELKPGVIYGLSNSILTNPWPKVKKGEALLADILKKNPESDEDTMVELLFDLLRTSEPMNDTTDITQVFSDLSERICIPKFDFPADLAEPTYATKTSTVVLVDHENRVTFVERDWHDENLSPFSPGAYEDISYRFTLEK